MRGQPLEEVKTEKDLGIVFSMLQKDMILDYKK